MMRETIVVANWKMNLPPAGIAPYLDRLTAAPDSPVSMVLAPPFPYIERIAGAASSGRFGVAAQNCSAESKGAFTGEVSVGMLKDIGAGYVIVGHSERRNLFGESSDLVGRKAAAAVEGGLAPILCIGEDLETREASRTVEFLRGQIMAAKSGSLTGASPLIVAYEPIWAIGTGRNASGSMVAETGSAIRELVGELWGRDALERMTLLYGGSVTPDNVDELVAEGAVDGFLVGGASLDAEKFLRIRTGLEP